MDFISACLFCNFLTINNMKVLLSCICVFIALVIIFIVYYYKHKKNKTKIDPDTLFYFFFHHKDGTTTKLVLPYKQLDVGLKFGRCSTISWYDIRDKPKTF